MILRKNTYHPGSDILLVNPWIYDFAAYDLWAKPLGLLSIAAVLRSHGYRPHLIDCLTDSGGPLSVKGRKRTYGHGKLTKEIVPKPAAYRHIPRRYGRYGISQEAFGGALERIPEPAAILVTSGMTYWYPGVFRAIELLRGRFRRVPILLGGIYATLCTDHARRHSGADLVLPGPGELAALKAVDDIVGHRRPRRTFDDLDDIPFAAFDLYRRLDYACLLTSRGCPYRCTYCAAGLLSPGLRRRSVDNVLAELERLRDEVGVCDIALYDDALLVAADEHIKPLLEAIIRRRLDLRFHTPNGLHVRLLDRELTGLMFRAGFKTVRLGMETADEDRQRCLGFKAARQDLVRALEHLRAAGFTRRQIGVYLLAGLPGQPFEEIAESVDFVSALGARVKLALYSPIPGTSEWDRAVRGGLVDPECDPLCHNNTFLAHSSSSLPNGQLEAIKRRILEQNPSAPPPRRRTHGVPERAEPDRLQLHL
jgi:hypothetical protein